MMDRLPTLLVVAQAHSQTEAHQAPEHLCAQLHTVLQMSQASGLPTVLVTPVDRVKQIEDIYPKNSIVTLPDRASATPFVAAMAYGILASAHANGWVILPERHAHMVRQSTVQKMAHSLSYQTMAYPQYKQQQGLPLAFSSEFYSELIRMASDRDLSRLMNRYPATAVEVDDPGVLLTR